MNKVAQIRGYAHEPLADDGLPPLPPLPRADCLRPKRVVRLMTDVDAYFGETVCNYARGYARTCLVAQDMEIHVLKSERDALKAELDELRGHGSR